MWSSSYVNSLLNVTSYVWDATGLVEPDAYDLNPQPPDALINLRSQCESQAKQQQV